MDIYLPRVPPSPLGAKYPARVAQMSDGGSPAVLEAGSLRSGAGRPGFPGFSRGLQPAVAPRVLTRPLSAPRAPGVPRASASPLITSHVGLGSPHRTSFSPNHPFPRPASSCSLVLRGWGSVRTLSELGGTPLSSCQPPCDWPWCLGPPDFFQPPTSSAAEAEETEVRVSACP